MIKADMQAKSAFKLFLNFEFKPMLSLFKNRIEPKYQYGTSR